jgi:hypothetical protein
MKLWLLRPVPEDSLWKPWYDKSFGFVVRAETESHARKIAEENAGDENRQLGDANTERCAWLNATHSTCVELTPDGEPGLIIVDFASA